MTVISGRNKDGLLYPMLEGRELPGWDRLDFPWPEDYPAYKPVYVQQLHIDIEGGIEELPWSLRVIGYDVYRAIVICVRADVGFLPKVFEQQMHFRNHCAYFHRHCRRAYELITGRGFSQDCYRMKRAWQKRRETK